MAKFGLFGPTSAKPLQEYEGDYMQQDNQFVQIMEKSTDQNKGNKMLAAIHVDAGQSVKKI